ncbi:MAG: VanZ family protein [Steroidobacteraceae bacterium]
MRNIPSRWAALVLAIALIVYGSLYPFTFDWQSLWHPDRSSFPFSWYLKRPLPADLIVNILFYVPFGAALASFLPRRWSVGIAVVAAAFIAGIASAALETLQHAVIARDPSLTDVVLNILSAVLGLTMARVYGDINVRRLKWVRHGQLPMLPAALVFLWLAIHCVPFVPDLGLYKLAVHWQEFLGSDLSGAQVAYFFAMTLIVVTAIRASVSRDYFWRALAIVVAAGLGARLLVRGQVLEWNECIAWILALPVAVTTRTIPWRQTRLPIFVLSLLAVALYGLLPFDLETFARPFYWSPMSGFLESDQASGYRSFMEKLLVYGGLLWVSSATAGSLVLGCAALVLTSLTVEFCQRYMPGRVAEITDPLMVLLLALFMLSSAFRGRAGGAERARSQNHPSQI